MSKTFDGGIAGGVFNRNSKRSGNQQKQYPEDLYVEVKEIVAADNNKGYISGVNKNGKNVRVYINQDAYNRNEEYQSKKALAGTSSEKVKFMGHRIDNDMKKHIEPKNTKIKKVIMATQALYETTKKIDGESVSIYKANYIEHVTNLKKFFYRPVTLFSRVNDEGTNSVFFFQVWNEKAISIHNKEELKKLAEKIDEANSVEDFSLVPYGIQFRTLVKTSEAGLNFERPFVNVAVSRPFDYYKNEGDEKGQNITGDFLLDMFEKYAEYINSNEQLKEAFGDIDLIHEVAYYNSYPATSYGNNMKFKESQTGSPLYQMARTKTGTSVGNSEDCLMGKNYGGRIYIMLSPDQKEEYEDADTGETITVIKHSNYVNRVYANVRKNNIHYYIQADNFNKTYESEEEELKDSLVAIHSDLSIIRGERQNVNEDASTMEEQMNNMPEEHFDNVNHEDEEEVTSQSDNSNKSKDNVNVVEPVTLDDDDIPF